MKQTFRINPPLPATAAGSGPKYDAARGGWYPPAKPAPAKKDGEKGGEKGGKR
ncbi:hypothetical protein GCM10009757_28110 [Streptomyces cheonanensis]|uniref:Uncharacterized protein n=1 Tax=Streptomyces cheonanensis TaxID=312720 RepID=A0ABP5GTI5_9ACTN|nr:hypothetical protein [Streptomyces harbinensis]QKV70013.1 hypothetical protein HUT13_15445 [Streptomyces harbinensis]